MFRTIRVAPLLAASAASAAIVLAPAAVAQAGNGCANDGGAVVCQSPGNANVFATPPVVDGGAANQNGPYGPYGDRPPTGD